MPQPDKTQSTKSFGGFEIKDAEKGEVEAVVATYGVVDKDKDIIRKGAIEDGATVLMSRYGHDAVFGNQPVGKGKIYSEGDKAIFKGKLFMGTQAGRETFEVLKEVGSWQQWSFGFRTLGAETPSDEESKAGARQILTKLDAFEVSPVIIGAGVGTRTLAVKEAPPVDPAVEAARIAAEKKEADEKAALNRINASAEERFNRMPSKST